MFMSAMSDWLELERGVLHIEVVGQARLEFVKQAGKVPIVEAVVLDDDMRRKHRETGCHLSGVKVVDGYNVRDAEHVVTDIGQVHTTRGCFQENVDGLAQHPNCAWQDQ
jgi:hypothetical protein